MGDSLKLFKDKRHRSSSSIAGVALEGTLSERKLDIKASIPEGDDQFVIAEARCEDLQEKIDLVKILKKKRKLKKRSMTRIMEQHTPDENVPFISVRAKPKKKQPQQAARSYKDPDVVEQHRMISENAKMNYKEYQPGLRPPGGQPCGDGTCGRGVQISTRHPVDPRFSAEETEDFSDYDREPLNSKARNKLIAEGNKSKKQGKSASRRRLFKIPTNEEEDKLSRRSQGPEEFKKLVRRAYKKMPPQSSERPVVELFNKNQGSSSGGSSQGMAQAGGRDKGQDAEVQDGTAGLDGVYTPSLAHSRAEVPRSVRRLRTRMRRGYEMPTVASRMKQTRAHLYIATTNATRIPFITSKSTSPSHNIGVNIQQVLNGLKTQQPPSGIPMTIAHHMGFRRCPVNGTKSSHAAPGFGNEVLNTIQLGRRMLRLPIYKVSYNRLLELLREGDGMVPKFLSGVGRPHYSLSECKYTGFLTMFPFTVEQSHPEDKKYLYGAVDPSALRASASTAGEGYHQSPSRLNAGDAMM